VLGRLAHLDGVASIDGAPAIVRRDGAADAWVLVASAPAVFDTATLHEGFASFYVVERDEFFALVARRTVVPLDGGSARTALLAVPTVSFGMLAAPVASSADDWLYGGESEFERECTVGDFCVPAISAATARVGADDRVSSERPGARRSTHGGQEQVLAIYASPPTHEVLDAALRPLRTMQPPPSCVAFGRGPETFACTDVVKIFVEGRDGSFTTAAEFDQGGPVRRELQRLWRRRRALRAQLRTGL
jgi:hypothetical protein